MDEDIKRLNLQAEKHAKTLSAAKDELHRQIVGQDDVIERLLLALICNGHVLLEGVPGLAKTLMVRSLAGAVGGSFTRIQFTPDLLPADIVGTQIYNHNKGTFTTKKGPIFANFILADEINRAPPKVQSALLEAMQERQVTISGESFELQSPFTVLATQNPIETEGTYRLPEAQVDRFMFKLIIDYPSKDEEKKIMILNTEGAMPALKKAMDTRTVLDIQSFVPKVYCDDKVRSYVADIVDASRRPAEYGLSVNGLIEYGASPRASIWLVLAAKAQAMMSGRGYVLPEDVKSVAHDVMRHRIIVSYEAEAEDIDSDKMIDMILEKVRVP